MNRICIYEQCTQRVWIEILALYEWSIQYYNIKFTKIGRINETKWWLSLISENIVTKTALVHLRQVQWYAVI